jgi:hypothetical protein
MGSQQLTILEEQAIACFAHGLAHLIVVLGSKDALSLAGNAVLELVESRDQGVDALVADDWACSYTA